jgi:FlaA1/EpsC-like NDP-sugar epimerase
VRVVGGTSAIASALDQTRPDIVFVTIPHASSAALDRIVRSCEEREIDCRFVRREFDLDPQVVLGRAQT